MPERAEVAPARRVLALLEELTRSRRPLTDRQLMERVGGYGEGPNAARALRMDKAALKARGLIASNQPAGSEARQRGTSRSPYATKPEALRLTREEHAALQRARHDQRSGILLIGPVQPAATTSSRANEHVDRVLRLLRLIEEHEGPVPVDVVAASLDVSHRLARRTMRDLDRAFDVDVSLEYERDADDISYLDIASVELAREQGQPALSRGTDFLGLFAYTRQEIAERLSLIDAYVKSGSPDPETRSALASIQDKLKRWDAILQA